MFASSARSRLAAGAKAPPDLINVCFGPLWGLKSDISLGPRCANLAKYEALQLAREAQGPAELPARVQGLPGVLKVSPSSDLTLY
jgi:hypothetical protein